MNSSPPKNQKLSFKGFVKRWIGPGAVMVLIFIVSAILSMNVTTGDLMVQVVWPERLSSSIEGQLVLVVRDDSKGTFTPAQGAAVELF